MGKSKSRSYDKEFDQLQKLKHENKKLKQELATLRKELNRVYNRYDGLDDLLDQQYQETTKPKKEDLKKKWECFSCKQDYLRLLVITRPDGVYYLRRCPNCSKKTKLQKSLFINGQGFFFSGTLLSGA